MQSQLGVDGDGDSDTRINGAHTHSTRKRRADESSLNDDDRFAKRLNRLSLEVVPDINGIDDVAWTTSANGSNGAGCFSIGQQDETSSQMVPESSMSIDDTPHRVYIHNLDDELAESESDDSDKLIFLPDIERYFSKIPQQVLTGESTASDRSDQQQQMILYDVPQSLTVDKSHDNVRKAIIQARHRAMEKVVEEARHEDMNRRYAMPDEAESMAETAHGYGARGYELADTGKDSTADVMEMDVDMD